MNADERKSAAARALPLVDLTDLSDNCNMAAIDDLCARAQSAHGNVGAICIWPRYVSHARGVLKGALPIATVVNFPSGDTDIELTVTETKSALADGANEIDLVLPYRAFLAGDVAIARAMVEAVKSNMDGNGLLKVIIETGELESDEAIKHASELAINAGADFIKTSTGKVDVNATPHSARLMIEVIKQSGKTVGFKAAGGVKTTQDTATYLAIADEIMGGDWASAATFRFGASGVLGDLLAALDGGEVAQTSGY